VDSATYNGAAVSGAAQSLLSAGAKAFDVSNATPAQAPAPIAGTTGADTLSGTAGADVLIGGGGKDAITGGAGADTFVYRAMSDAGDRITDFSAAEGDRLDLSAILGAHGHGYADLRTGGFVALHSISDGVRVLVSADGPGTGYATMATLVGATEAGLGADFLFA